MSILDTLTSQTASDRNLATKRLDPDDWFKPTLNEPQADRTDRSNSFKANERTDSVEPKRWKPPIRRSNLGIKLDGDRVKIEQQWECIVLDVSDEVVSCEMLDLTDERNPSEFAEVYKTEFSEFDRQLLHEGSVFYWSVGHIRKPTGQIRRHSEIRVRRMPALTRTKEAEIARKVQRLGKLIQSQ